MDLKTESQFRQELSTVWQLNESLKRRIHELEGQRDELLAALKVACPMDIEELCDDCSPGPCSGCWVSETRAIIAKVDVSQKDGCAGGWEA